MKTPKHWKTKNILSLALWPLGTLYGLATALRIHLIRPRQVDAKVICVGNLTAGGTGKTPVAISLANILKKHGRHPVFVSRGYGGNLQNVMVDEAKHTARQVGDEPLLLCRHAPVVINHDRWRGAKTAQNFGADFIIMDDGFQNPGLHKDLSLLVIDGGFGLGNGFCIPAGPLREFENSGLKRADAVMIIGEDLYNLEQRFNHLPVFKGTVTPVMPGKRSGKVIAFAGIGRPSKFYQSLREVGFDVIATFDFPDHHFYTQQELQQLIELAQKHQATLYTTSKDMVKIPSVIWPFFHSLEITVKWEKPDQLAEFLLHR